MEVDWDYILMTPSSTSERRKVKLAIRMAEGKSRAFAKAQRAIKHMKKAAEKEAVSISQRQVKALEKAVREAKLIYAPRLGHITLKEPLHLRLGRKVHKGYATGRGTHYGRKRLLGSVEHLYKDRVFVSRPGSRGFGRTLTTGEQERILDLFKLGR